MGKDTTGYFHGQHAYLQFWSNLWNVFRSLNRQAELERFICWAKRKRLTKPLTLYKMRLQDEQVRHARYTLVSPRAATFAHVIHFLTTPFRPTIHYPRRGSAAFYRSQKLDSRKNGLIVFDTN